jgi:hypothetical protein
MDYLSISSRVLVVLVGSMAGLIAGSFIHYVFLEDTLVHRASSNQKRVSTILFALSIAVFIFAVYVLYLNRFPPVLVAFPGMLLTKLAWNAGDSYRYAGRLHAVLHGLDSDEQALKKFIREANSYRQIQDLRSVARSLFVPGSRQLKRLEALISEAHVVPDSPD